MIALTQEKREELIFQCECVIRSLKKSIIEHPGERSLEGALLRQEVALMALTASAVGSFHIYDQKVDATTDYIRDGEWPIDEGEVLVYTAPPVPAISQLENDVTNIVQLLSDREWAEHCTSTELGKELEGKITDLHDEVPEIKLVDEKQIQHVYHGAIGAFDAGKSAGWNECLAEIKRLNGLGEGYAYL